jgi:hypothetical protein
MPRKYLFADESGNFDFLHGRGSQFFAVGTIAIDASNLRVLREKLGELREGLSWQHQGARQFESFHASEDLQEVRNTVFRVLNTIEFRADVTLAEKRRVDEVFHTNHPAFYGWLWGRHIYHVAPHVFEPGDEAMIVAASWGTNRQRKQVRGAFQRELRERLRFQGRWVLAHWRDDTDFALQAADYCTWAVARMYERGDSRAFDQIRSKVESHYRLTDRYHAPTTFYR